MTTPEKSWKCEKHGMTWDIGGPCAGCHAGLEAEVERLKKMLRLAYERSGQAWNWSEDDWLELLRRTADVR